MKRKHPAQPVDRAVYSEAFTGSDGLMTAILNARAKLYREGVNIESVGISGVLALKYDENVGTYTMTLTTRR